MGKWMVSLVNSHTNATSKRWHLWEIDLRFALNSTPGWLNADGGSFLTLNAGGGVQSPGNAAGGLRRRAGVAEGNPRKSWILAFPGGTKFDLGQ